MHSKSGNSHIHDPFPKVRAKRTVFKRTRSRPELPVLVLYIEQVAGEAKRRVKDIDGNEHLIADTVLQSHFRMVSKTQATALIAEHWPPDQAAPSSATSPEQPQ